MTLPGGSQQKTQVQGVQVKCCHKPLLPLRRSQIWTQCATGRLWMGQKVRRWNYSARVCLHVVLSITQLSCCMMLCTAQRVNVDDLMSIAQIPSKSFI